MININKIPLTKKVFKSEADFKEAIQAVKDKKVTIDDIQLLIYSNVQSLYNSIVSHFFGCETIDSENIYKRDSLEQYITEFESHNGYLFPLLKQLGLIGVCGRGYTLDSQRLQLSNERYDRMIDVIFNKGLCI